MLMDKKFSNEDYTSAEKKYEIAKHPNCQVTNSQASTRQILVSNESFDLQVVVLMGRCNRMSELSTNHSDM